MKERMILTFISIYLLSLILASSASANAHYGTITDKPASATFIAFFTTDDDILTEAATGSTYNSGTGMWGFEDSNFNTPPNIGETGYIWLYGSNGVCYTDSATATGGPVDWGDTPTSGSNIEPPGNLTATPGPPGAITLNWTAASGATRYTIYRSVISNGAYETRVAEGITGTTYVDTGLSYQNYYYIVVGKDDSGNFGGHSNEAFADASLAVELASFTASADDKKVTLKWKTGSEVGNIGFYVYRSEKPDGNFKKISELIEGAGNSAMGRAYEYIDKDVEPNKTYFYYLEDIDVHGIREKSDTIQVTVKNPLLPKLPKEYKLFQNYPNPFNPETWMPFQLPETSEVTIRIYNAKGQLVKTIKLGHTKPGVYIEKSKAAHWTGRNNMGEKVASGVYFYELRTDKFRAIRKMILLK